MGGCRRLLKGAYLFSRSFVGNPRCHQPLVPWSLPWLPSSFLGGVTNIQVLARIYQRQRCRIFGASTRVLSSKRHRTSYSGARTLIRRMACSRILAKAPERRCLRRWLPSLRFARRSLSALKATVKHDCGVQIMRSSNRWWDIQGRKHGCGSRLSKYRCRCDSEAALNFQPTDSPTLRDKFFSGVRPLKSHPAAESWLLGSPNAVRISTAEPLRLESGSAKLNMREHLS